MNSLQIKQDLNKERKLIDLLILLKNCVIPDENNLINSGLCYEVSHLNYHSIINKFERDKLISYIKDNMPEYAIPDNDYANLNRNFNRIEFGWLPELWQPRLEWLNVHIEMNIEKEDLIRLYIKSCKKAYKAKLNKLTTSDQLKNERDRILYQIKTMKNIED